MPEGTTGERPLRVVAVTTTFRRLDRLPSLVSAVRGQTRAPDAYVVVDNGGGAADALPGADPGVQVVTPAQNLGPAGGYAEGFRRALDAGADRIWALDDDTLPDPGCLARELESPHQVVLPKQRRPSGSGLWLPWVGGLFDAELVRRAGLPREDYFYGAEDYEFLRRLILAGGTVDRLDEVLITHSNPARRQRFRERDWRLYYIVRNSLHYRFRMKRPTARTRFWVTVRLAQTAAAIAFLERHKRRSLGLLVRGIRDYRRDRLGKPIDPDEWTQAALAG